MDTSNTATIYPWQQPQWQQLNKAIEDNRLPHALLLSGQRGNGKNDFALMLSKRLLCQSPQNEMPCDQCQSCRLFNASTHPDFQLITPEEEGKAIKVDQIREMVDKNTLTSNMSGMKIHLILNAGQMNISASNSVLKTLEEPSPESLIILVTSSPEKLTATIKSRCQNIHLPVPDNQAARDWLSAQQIHSDPDLLLSLSLSAPLDALKLDDEELLTHRKNFFNDLGFVVFSKKDPVNVASIWQDNSPSQLIGWMTGWVVDMIRLKFSQSNNYIANNDLLKGLQKISEAFSINQLLEIYSKLLESKRLLDTQANRLLLLEGLLLRWTRANQ